MEVRLVRMSEGRRAIIDQMDDSYHRFYEKEMGQRWRFILKADPVGFSWKVVDSEVSMSDMRIVEVNMDVGVLHFGHRPKGRLIELKSNDDHFLYLPEYNEVYEERTDGPL